MINYYITDATGAVVKTGVCDEEAAGAMVGPGETVYEGAADPFRNYVTGGELLQYTPEQAALRRVWPGPGWIWNAQTMSWQDVRTAQQLQAYQHQAIEAERDRRINAVIAHDGANIDADERAQKNISDKLSEITQRELLGLPMDAQLLVWRDADNGSHVFETQAAYKAWLGALAIAIAQRGTLAYAWSWGKKAALQALGDDLDALRAFEPASESTAT